jgi:hypothetical protein
VLAELLEAGNPAAVRFAAAKEILDRRFGKPRYPAEIRAAGVDLGALHLDALREMAERALIVDKIRRLVPS